MKPHPKVSIYDTTLRDGTQGEGISFSVADKLRIEVAKASIGGYQGQAPVVEASTE